MSRSVQNSSACVNATVHCTLLFTATYYITKAKKLVTQAEKSMYLIKMIIKVSHCSPGKIKVSGHNVGSTETQGEGEARQGPALWIQMIR